MDVDNVTGVGVNSAVGHLAQLPGEGRRVGGRDVAAPDLRLRRAYSTTVVLRNRRS